MSYTVARIWGLNKNTSGFEKPVKVLVTLPFIFTTLYRVPKIEVKAWSSRLQPIFNHLLILQESSSGILWFFNYEKLQIISIAIFYKNTVLLLQQAESMVLW